MRILFISPDVSKNIEISPPHGLACLVAYINKVFPEIHTDIIDLNVSMKSFDDISFEDYQIIGFGFTTPSATWVYEKTYELKKKLGSKVIIIHGGIHASILPEESLKHGADIVVRGEGEITFTKLIQVIERNFHNYKFMLSSIAGISYVNNEKFIHNVDSEFVKNLDDLAWPDWSYFNLDLYNHNLHVRRGFAFPIMASRGCPFSCEFCCSPAFWKRKVRYRSVVNVISELKYNIKKFNINRFHFYDDDFLINSEFVEEFCLAVIKERLDINYVIMARSDSINRNRRLLKLLKDSGCIMIEFGVENTDAEILNSMNKNIDLNSILETAQLLKEYEIEPFYLILFCYPGETISSLYEMNKFMTKIQDTPSLTYGAYLVPYPGSKFEKRAKSTGLIITDNLNEYLPSEIVFIPNSMLDQVPVYTDRLNDKDLNFLTSHYISATRMYGFDEVKRLINELYMIMDGSNTVRNIVNIFSLKVGMDAKSCYRFVYKYLNYFSQLGLIKEKGESYRGIQLWYSNFRKP